MTIEKYIEGIKAELVLKAGDENGSKIGEYFERFYYDTLNKTIKKRDDGTCFIITGDIPAMWLRDSSCQMKPYILLAKENEEIAAIIRGITKTQIRCINIDPYANAFNESANGNCYKHDKTDMKSELWERKYEIDSLCFPIELAYKYWENTGDESIFDDEFLDAIINILNVFRTEQNHEEESAYRFEREDCIYTDTLSREGKGALVKSGIGLVWSGFRPSDDACTYGYLIPSNMLAAVVLNHIQEILKIYMNGPRCITLTGEYIVAEHGLDGWFLLAGILGKEIREAIDRYAVVPGGDKYKPFYAYEVDGFGQYNIMDDANLPSLLSAPYFGYCDYHDEIYLNTKERILSDTNPFYFKGDMAEGIGSPHTPEGYIWHISMGMRGLVSDDENYKLEIIKNMMATDGGTGNMHEGFDVNDAVHFTREWFSWANSIFIELVLNYLGKTI